MDFGFWILEFGFWSLDFGNRILDFGVWILDFGFWSLDFGFLILEFGFWISDFGFWSLDFGFRILDFRFWILDFGFWSLDFGFLILDFGVWILDFGFRILEFGVCISDFGLLGAVWILHKIFPCRAGSGRRIYFNKTVLIAIFSAPHKPNMLIFTAFLLPLQKPLIFTVFLQEHRTKHHKLCSLQRKQIRIEKQLPKPRQVLLSPF